MYHTASGDLLALRRCSLDVHVTFDDGSVVGPSGCGKLSRLGFLAPTKRGRGGREAAGEGAFVGRSPLSVSASPSHLVWGFRCQDDFSTSHPFVRWFAGASLCPDLRLGGGAARRACPGCPLAAPAEPARGTRPGQARARRYRCPVKGGPHDFLAVGSSMRIVQRKGDLRGTCQRDARAPQPCIRRIAAIRTHDAVMRIGGKAPRWRFPFSPARMDIMP